MANTVLQTKVNRLYALADEMKILAAQLHKQLGADEFKDAPKAKREWSDDLIKQALQEIYDEGLYLNSFQEEFCRDVPARDYPLTDRQYEVCMRIFDETNFNLKAYQEELDHDDAEQQRTQPTANDDIPF